MSQTSPVMLKVDVRWKWALITKLVWKRGGGVGGGEA